MASPTGTPKGVLDVFKSDVIKSLDALYRLRPGKPNRLGGQLTEESYTRLVTSLADAFKFLKSQVDDPAILQAHQLAQSPNVVTVDEFEETTALGVACQVTLTVYLGLVDLLTAGTLTEKFSQIRKVEQQFPLAKLKRVSGRLDSEVVAVCRLADSKKPRKAKRKGKKRGARAGVIINRDGIPLSEEQLEQWRGIWEKGSPMEANDELNLDSEQGETLRKRFDKRKRDQKKSAFKRRKIS